MFRTLVMECVLVLLVTQAGGQDTRSERDQERRRDRPEVRRTDSDQHRAEAHHDIPLPKHAVAVFIPTEGHDDVHGTVMLTQEENYVRVLGHLTGLPPGKHGFHIHEFGDLRAPDGSSAGGHFNPSGKRHGAPTDAEHHVGDLGNILANEQGVAKVDAKIKGVPLHFVIGRALVVHEKADDFESQPSGDAGARLALGVIGFANFEKDETARPAGKEHPELREDGAADRPSDPRR
jgi:superoxide dismutase, Cu-Zn family